jgi:carotenoid cleavage dioxygenase-like enzyme
VYDTKGLVRFDLNSGETQKWQHQAGGSVGEALYVPSTNGAGLQEDAGYVLFPLYDANSDTSSLEIHDATDLAGGALASVKLPVRIPAGFHGNWFEAGQLNSSLA